MGAQYGVEIGIEHLQGSDSTIQVYGSLDKARAAYQKATVPADPGGFVALVELEEQQRSVVRTLAQRSSLEGR